MGTQNFSMSHARDKTKNTFLQIHKCKRFSVLKKKKKNYHLPQYPLLGRQIFPPALAL